jgi:hypothetical protein
MLQQGSAAGGHRCRDLQLRMHLLPGLRGDNSRWALPELRRRVGGSSHPPGRETSEVSSIHRARGEIGRLRQSFSLTGSATEGTNPAEIEAAAARLASSLAISARSPARTPGLPSNGLGRGATGGAVGHDDTFSRRWCGTESSPQLAIGLHQQHGQATKSHRSAPAAGSGAQVTSAHASSLARRAGGTFRRPAAGSPKRFKLVQLYR